MNEGTWVQGKSLAINRQPNGEAWSIFDANWKTDLVNGLPYGGGMFWDSFRPYGSDLELAPQYFETQIPEYIKAGNAYQADTLDELAKQIGCDAATFKATVERYNGMCEAGEDTDYYKKPVFLTPVKEGPFYALKVGPALLAIPGGFIADRVIGPWRATLYGGASVRTDKVGWYLRTNKSLAIDTDGNYYSLVVPAGFMARFRGVQLVPTLATMQIGKGGRDGETGDLDEFLERAFAHYT